MRRRPGRRNSCRCGCCGWWCNWNRWRSRERHRRALAERRVTVVQGADGIGYVTGEISAADAAAIDALLAATSRSLGAEDPRTDQQRRADLFADLLLGRIAFDQPDSEKDEADDKEADEADEPDEADEADERDEARGGR